MPILTLKQERHMANAAREVFLYFLQITLTHSLFLSDSQNSSSPISCWPPATDDNEKEVEKKQLKLS